MLVRCDDILVADRQRKEFTEIEILAESMQRLGQIQPIVLDGMTLIAGERRLRAAKHNQWETIEAVQFNDLDELTRKEIEIEENIKRKDLNWWEVVEAVLSYHEAREARDPEWKCIQTAQHIGLDDSVIYKYMMVAKELRTNPGLKNMPGYKAALNYVIRMHAREMDKELDQFHRAESDDEDIMSGIADLVSKIKDPDQETGKEVEIPEARVSPSKFRVLNLDFIQTAKQTPGRTLYNFMHCDFPYGIGMDTNELQGTRQDLKRYADSEETYWALCNALLENQERLFYPSAHIMFWFSMKYYIETKALFEANGWKVNPQPMIWMKSDQKGIIADPQRGPRNICETAFLMSRGDRKIVRAVSNGVWLPTEKADSDHLSEKPVSVLKHFFQMFIDKTTEMLDPTCGTGTSVLAALELGAERGIGIEIDEDHARRASNRVQDAIFKFDPASVLNSI